jgi:hypothetical protein
MMILWFPWICLLYDVPLWSKDCCGEPNEIRSDDEDAMDATLDDLYNGVSFFCWRKNSNANVRGVAHEILLVCTIGHGAHAQLCGVLVLVHGVPDRRVDIPIK